MQCVGAALLLTACGGELAIDDDSDLDEAGWESNDGVDYQRMSSCPSGGKVKPGTPSFSSGADGYGSYVGQSTCSGSEKPGVVAFKKLVLATYPCTYSGGIVRGCSIGGKSEHKEGRAWDWMIKYPHPAADNLLSWLLATDSKGNKHAMARRVGIMYMIWNRKIWKSYQASKGWQTYTGSNPHTDHVHFSFTWNGANKKTSFWNGSAVAPTPAPAPAPTPDPGNPLMTITSHIATIGGQVRDLCTGSSSKGIFDWWVGQQTEVLVDIKNSGTAVAKNVRVGLWAEQPYVRITQWNIQTNWNSTGFVANDTDGMQTIAHADPPQSFTLWLAAMSPGETKRVRLKVKAIQNSLGLTHPDIRAWVAHVDKYYDKASYSASFTNVSNLQKQNSGNLRHYSQTDVLVDELCDGKDNDCDGQVDEGSVCGGTSPAAPDSGVPAPAAPDSGVPAPAPGSGLAPDSGAVLMEDGGGFDPQEPERDPEVYPSRPARGRTISGACNMGAEPAGSPWLLVVLLGLVLRRLR